MDKDIQNNALVYRQKYFELSDLLNILYKDMKKNVKFFSESPSIDPMRRVHSKTNSKGV